VFAALAAPLWALEYAGWLPVPYFRNPTWHAHEMIFGFALAVVTGFLFTAVRNWTQRPTPTGVPLMLLAALWIAGRVTVAMPHGPVASLVNAAFPAAVAIAIAIPLVKSGNKRNYFFVGLLALAAAAALALHHAARGILDLPPRSSLQVGVDIVLLMVAVIGGRVIPMFTNNAIAGASASRKPWIERAALGSVVAALAADILPAPEWLVALVCIVAAVANAARFALWHPERTLRTPMVWILHASYAWIPVYFALRALGIAEVIPSPLATHALTVGAIGGMTIGMMTRTARGHTGRTIAADRGETAMFVLMQLAALVRVGVPLVLPALYMPSVIASAFLWSASFAIYFVSYFPVLTLPRVDGKPD
jgi:uncharacterized protein involved in response to NO